MELPTELRLALELELQTVPAVRLTQAAADLIERYRLGRTCAPGGFRMSDVSVLAYAVYRMPATYAAISAALMALSRQSARLEPRSILDIGAGTGAGLWAAAAVWPSLQRMTAVDRDERMISLGRRLAADAFEPPRLSVDWRALDVADRPDIQEHDVVLAAYVLNEVPEAERPALLDFLWAKASTAVIIVEPGTPVGFEGIRVAREYLLQRGARMVAPCPHERECPMAGGDWCHFAARIRRSRIHRLVKDGELPYEDEKFSYLAVAREPGRPIAGRVLRHPRILKRRVQVGLCTPGGLTTEMYTKGKQRDLYRIARDLSWGDALQPEDTVAESGFGAPGYS